MLLDPDMDAEDIAHEFLTSPQQVAHWSSLPKLRDTLAALRDIYVLRLEILLLKARVSALSTLDQIARSGDTKGPSAELTRRAATTILKLKLDAPPAPPAYPHAPRGVPRTPNPPPQGEVSAVPGGRAEGASLSSPSTLPCSSVSPPSSPRHRESMAASNHASPRCGTLGRVPPGAGSPQHPQRPHSSTPSEPAPGTGARRGDLPTHPQVPPFHSRGPPEHPEAVNHDTATCQLPCHLADRVSSEESGS